MIATDDLLKAIRKKIDEAKDSFFSCDPNNAGHVGRIQGRMQGLTDALGIIESAIEDEEKEIE